ncbi:MAG TPA: metalloregulator ArsR/SmtB family transcription factor [Burkholderiaceae bacterium]|nr:metalloregulator ArsR/SmtB family transcription factor [Burkholderiaceae bacterium]
MDELGRVFEAVSQYFALLSEPMRVRILHAICQREKSVSEIVAETGATQTNVSRHLGSMYRSGVLSRRKLGTSVYYGVGDPVLTEICRSVCVHIAARDGDPGRRGLLTIAQDLDNAPQSITGIAVEPARTALGASAGNPAVVSTR